MLRILVLSFYYYPDLCAGSFRCSALIEQLKKLAGTNYEIDVITTVPNRYASFPMEAPESEQQPGLKIQRIALPPHESGMLDQARAFAHFAFGVNKRIKNCDYALVFATSSRLMTLALGTWVARRKGAKLYLDVRDLFADTIKEILPAKTSFFLNPIFSLIENWSVKHAHRINLVSKGFQEYFNNRYPAAELRWFSNGIDSEFILEKNNTTLFSSVSTPLTVIYAGNIGEGQGLHLILPRLAKRMEGKVNFKIIGDGGRKMQLITALQEARCTNVTIAPPIGRQQLITEYQQADVLFLHLNDYNAFLKVLPSKIFEYAAMGKPIWAGVSGYSAKFIQAEVSNAAIFGPCNVGQAEEVFAHLKLKNAVRKDFIEKYERKKIMRQMAADMLSLI